MLVTCANAIFSLLYLRIFVYSQIYSNDHQQNILGPLFDEEEKRNREQVYQEINSMQLFSSKTYNSPAAYHKSFLKQDQSTEVAFFLDIYKFMCNVKTNPEYASPRTGKSMILQAWTLRPRARLAKPSRGIALSHPATPSHTQPQYFPSPTLQPSRGLSLKERAQEVETK